MEKIDESVILRYLQRKSTQDDFRIMNEWMSVSPDNKRFLFAVEELFSKAKWEDDEERLEYAFQRLKSRIQSEVSTASFEKHHIQKKFGIKMIIPFIRYAAAVIFVAIIGGLSYHWLNKEDRIEVSADSKIKRIELPDGTKVWLNKGSYLSYSEKFSDDDRKVFLNGEAYFEVTRKPEKQLFVVESKMLNVVVRGTVFNMNSYSNGSKAEASLIEGEVLVETPDKDSRIVLLPGQKAVFDNNSARLTVKETDASMDGVWRNDMLPFRNATIKDIADALKKLYNVDIHVDSDVDINSTYSGMIKKKDNLEEVMKALKNSIPIDYEIKNNSIFIKSRK